MAWFKIADGRLRFRGRITQEPVVEWLTSEDGVAAVQAAASQIRFALFGRTRAARRRMRRELWSVLDTPAVRASIASECDHYLAAWAELAYAPSLPRATIALHRLVVVPRTMILARTLSRVLTRLAACPGIADLPDPFKAFSPGGFSARWMTRSGARRPRLGVLSALRSRGPASPSTPTSHGSTRCGPGPTGVATSLMFEMPPTRLKRRERLEVEAAIERWKQTLPSLSRQQRDGTVQVAMDGMRLLRV